MKNMTRSYAVAALASGLLSIALCPGSLLQAAGTLQPAEPSATGEQTKVAITVKALQGTVFAITKPGAKPTPVSVGTILDSGAELITTLKSAVQVQIGAGQIFTIDFNSRIRLKEVINLQGTEKTSVEMAYGRITFDVTSTQVSNDVTITAPDATLAVKGTTGGLMSRPGFEPLAFGGEMNKGRFDVKFSNKIIAQITGSESSSGKPLAEHENAKQYANVGQEDALEDSESEALKSQGLNSPLLFNTPGARAEAGDSDKLVHQEGVITGPSYFALNAAGTALYERDLYLGSRLDRTGLSGIEGVIQGAAIITDSETGQRILMVVDNVFGPNGNTPVFRVLNLDSAGHKFDEIARVEPTPSINGFDSYTLFGLGVLNNTLYSSGIGPQLAQGQIFEINLKDKMPSITSRMDLGFAIEPAMTAAPTRGTLFAIAQAAQILGGGRDWALFELNPTTNFMVNGWTTINPTGNNFINQVTTGASVGASFNSIYSVTGMTFVNGMLVISGLTANNTPITVQFNPSASNTAFDPNVRIVDTGATAFNSPGMAAYAASLGQLQPTKSPAATTRPLTHGGVRETVRFGEFKKLKKDFTLLNDGGGVTGKGGGGPPPQNFGLFGQMGFTTAAMQSGAALIAIREQILAQSGDRQGMINSGMLNTLPGILVNYQNQPGGMGMALHSFYNQFDLHARPTQQQRVRTVR